MTSIHDYLQQIYEKELYPPIIVDLPSRGIIYDSNSVFNKTQKILCRKLTGKIEEWGGELIYEGNIYNINKLLENQIFCNVNPKICVDDLLIGDRDAMIFAYRILTYG